MNRIGPTVAVGIGCLILGILADLGLLAPLMAWFKSFVIAAFAVPK